jgi:hypothetical protein
MFEVLTVNNALGKILSGYIEIAALYPSKNPD